jgi:hypothetical protein
MSRRPAPPMTGGMRAVDPQFEGRGLDLLLLHCRALDYERPNASERLAAMLGDDLARMLVFALSGCGRETRELVAA